MQHQLFGGPLKSSDEMEKQWRVGDVLTEQVVEGDKHKAR